MTNKGKGKGGNGGRVQFNVTIRTSMTTCKTTSIYLDVDPSLFSRADTFAEVFSAGLLIPATGVDNAVWYPLHAIVKVEFMGTAPEKPRDDRHEDY